MLCYFVLPNRKTNDGPINVNFMLELEEVWGGEDAAFNKYIIEGDSHKKLLGISVLVIYDIIVKHYTTLPSAI